MKEINLTQGKTAKVDDDDYEYLSQWKWHATSGAYAARKEYWDGIGFCILMHRVINQTPSHLVTEHVNNDPLDNRKTNLRSRTKNQILRNNTKSSQNKDIFWNKHRQKYQVHIEKNELRVFVGLFISEEKAVIAHNNAKLSSLGKCFRENVVWKLKKESRAGVNPSNPEWII